MAELYVQKKKNNNWLIWLIVVIILLIGVYYLYINYYQDPQVISLFEGGNFKGLAMAGKDVNKI